MNYENLISIVMPVFNAQAYLEEALESVRRQTWTDWELLVVDDHSTDGSAGLVSEICRKDARIRLLSQMDGIKGAANARNFGTAHANGRYLAFMDADDIWRVDKLEREMAFLREKDAAFVFCSYEFGDEHAVGTGKIVRVPDQLTYQKALSRTVIFTSTVLFDREKIDKALLQMPDVPSEDTAMWWQILRNGHVAYGLKENLVIYRRPEKSLSSNKLRAITRIWGLYRKQEKMSVIASAACFCMWAVRAVWKKNDSVKRLIILALGLIGLCVLTAFYAHDWFAYYYHHIAWKTHNRFNVNGHLLIVALYFILLFFFSNTYGALKIGYLKPLDIFLSQLFSLLCVNVISYAQLSLMYGWFIIGGGHMVSMMLYQLVFAGLWGWLCNLIYRRAFPPRELLLVHGERPVEDILGKFAGRKDKYHVAKCMNIKEGYDAVIREVGKYDAVVLWDIHTMDRNVLLKYCYSHSIRVYMMPKIPDVLVKGSEQLHLFDTPILLTREYALNVEQRIAKRFIDTVCSLILIVVTSPIMLITAVVIKLYDKGPVLYKQVRCTKDAKEFYILKFRSMRVDAEKDGVARLAAKNDSRITPVGKFIRAVRIDELPQLFNILKGEMSFIGPRPERPQIIREYIEEMPEFAYRTRVKAGLAGYAQVYGKYNTTPYDKLKLDLFYIENYSVWLDLKLMLLTLKILFTPDSTEGVDEKQVTAMKKQVQEEEK